MKSDTRPRCMVCDHRVSKDHGRWVLVEYGAYKSQSWVICSHARCHIKAIFGDTDNESDLKTIQNLCTILTLGDK